VDNGSLGSGVPLLCGVRTDGSLDCFRNGPYSVTPPEGTFEEVALGSSRACAIRTDHSLACFGPVESAVLSVGFQHVSMGWSLICGIDTDGALACWDINSGDIVFMPDGSFDQVAVVPGDNSGSADSEACGISDGSVRCWDAWGDRKLEGPFLQISVNLLANRYALRDDGSVVTISEYPSMGTIEAIDHVMWGKGYVKIAAANDAMYALRDDGTLARLPLPDGVAVDVPSDDQFVDLAAGGDYCCALSSDGHFRCFGSVIR
jgi:hypothetical protein